MRLLFVGINPGVRSAVTGHHFAGYSNRFWQLLHQSGLTPELLTAEEDGRLPQWGYGITNLIARPSPGIDTLRPEEFVVGARQLRRKVARWRPEVVALVGVTVYRALFRVRTPVALGLQPETLAGAEVFVLPNPSGRNANYSRQEMLDAFTALHRQLARKTVARRRPQ